MKQPRDMTRRQFVKACAENGFKLEMLWLVDQQSCAHTGYGLIVRPNGKIMRRASLAKALRLRAEDAKRNPQQCAA